MARQPVIKKIDGEDMDDHRVSFEVKLLFMVAILFFYPVALCVQLYRKPSVQYWVGPEILYVSIFVVLWILACHFALVARTLKRSNGALVMVIIPGALLAITCQVQELHIRSVASALLSQDCTSFEDKARLERAWTSAHDVVSNCSSTLSDITGASPSDTRQILRVENCDGYAHGYATYGAEWDYLTYMEEEHHCGGWCESHRAVWQPSERVQDSCSLAAARVMGGSIARLGRQVTVYSAILLFCASLSLLVMPSLLGSS